MASKSSKSSSKSSSTSAGPAALTTAEKDKLVSADSAALVAGSDAAVGVEPQRGDRTATQKVDALAKVTEKAAKVDSQPTAKMLPELATGSEAEKERAMLWVIEILRRALGMDFIHNAAPAEVLSGEAHLRAAASPGKESPQRVDDAVIPAGMNNPTDELLPPNILTSDVPRGFNDHPAVKAAKEGAPA